LFPPIPAHILVERSNVFTGLDYLKKKKYKYLKATTFYELALKLDERSHGSIVKDKDRKAHPKAVRK
jgi:hypothetical protein